MLDIGKGFSERERLCHLVEQWNENRLDLFSLSYPTEDLEIHGVIRFYFQESKDKVSTKCIRVSSTATTRAVIDALVDKFHPDLKMLSDPEYSVWEVHENGEERKLAPDERPLLVQLNWNKDDREGRFVLKKYLPNPPFTPLQNDSEDENWKRGFKRFSKREKKELKKKHQRALAAKQEEVVESIYKALPPTTFTRTISNPEIVMKKRRERKLEAKLKEIGQGGSLKIYGYELVPSRPYVTLLVSVKDRASKIVKETLEKYGLEKENVEDYGLVEITLPFSDKFSRSLSDLRSLEDAGNERFLNDNECPLINLANRSQECCGEILYAIRKRQFRSHNPQAQHCSTAILHPRHNSLSFTATNLTSISTSSTNSAAYANPRQLSQVSNANRHHTQPATSPYLVALSGGIECSNGQLIPIQSSLVEIGSDRTMQICLSGDRIRPRHAVITFVDGFVTITPSVSNADIEVDDQRISQTVILHNGSKICIGHSYLFQYFDSQVLAISSAERASRGCDSVMSSTRSRVSDRGFSRENVVASTPQMRPLSPQSITRTTIPALIEISELTEDEFLSRVISSETERLHFQLGPSLLVYMAARFFLSPYYRSTLSEDQKKQRTRIFFIKVVERFRLVTKDYRLSKESLAFWLANSSELLNIMKQDKELSVVTVGEPQQFMTDAVENSFNLLGVNLKDQLRITINSFIDTRFNDRTACSETIAALDDSMRLLRRCRLNIALTIQLFSQLFHFINAYLFNWLVSPSGGTYCSTAFGVRLRTRLRAIYDWAEKQGLELAAECNMDKIQQAVTLLITPKRMDQIANLGTTCYKLNSIQVRYLLEHIVLDVGEEPIGTELVESVVRLAETLADDMARQDGTGIQLDEQLTLQLPFLLPLDGYSIDVLHGIPSSVREFAALLETQGLCGTITHPNSSCGWTVYFSDDIPTDSALNDVSQNRTANQMSLLPHNEINNIRDNRIITASEASANLSIHSASPSVPYDSPYCGRMQPTPFYADGRNREIMLVSLNRGASSIGLSIVAAQGIGERCVGIYIKKVVEGSAAAKDGRLQPGDQLLSVNGQSLVGISQEEAAAKMAAAGPNITFEVNKHAACYNGLSDWLSCPPITSQMINCSTFDQASGTSYGPPSSVSTLQNDRRAPTLTQHNDHLSHTRQNSVPSTTAVYSTGGYAEYGGLTIQPPQQIPNRANNSGYSRADPQLRSNARSLSATELYQNLVPGSSTNSLTSLPLPRGFGGSGASHVYNHGSAHSSAHLNMSSRYRIGVRDAIRPTVIQSSRLITSPRTLRCPLAPSQIYGSVPSTSELATQTRNSVSSPQYHHNGHSVSSTDYINLHYADQYLPSDASFSSSPLHSQSFNHYHSNSAKDSLNIPSSSNTNDSRYESNASPPNAPGNILQLPPEPPSKSTPVASYSKRDELNEELDKLEIKGSAMTEDDQRKYRQLVNELSKVREPLLFKTAVRQIRLGGTDEANSVTAIKLKENGDVNIKLSEEQFQTEHNSIDPKPMTTAITRANDKNAEELIGKLQKDMNNLTECPPAVNKDTVGSTTALGIKVLKRKKGVQWNEEDLEASDEVSNRLLFKDIEEPEPRVQVLGTQEVYRDPRLRRLNEIQARKNASQPTVDGANLGFRDKMKLFAEQAGEKSLKTRYKTSSAQREIEQLLD